MEEDSPVSERRLLLCDESDLVVARRHVRALGERQGLAVAAIEALATAVTEIARNVLVHAGGGQMWLRAEAPERAGPRPAAVVAIIRDHGPGIADIEAAMADGFSTGSGLGLGLPGARRLVDVFELHSRVGEGTTVRLEKWGPARDAHL